MMMNDSLELGIFGLLGMLLTLVTLGVDASPRYFASPGGGMGVPLEMAVADEGPLRVAPAPRMANLLPLPSTAPHTH